MSLNKHALVKVTWHDAADKLVTWVEPEEAQAFADAVVEIESVGWVVSHGPKYLTLAADMGKDGEYSRLTKIPNGMVISAELLQTQTHDP